MRGAIKSYLKATLSDSKIEDYRKIIWYYHYQKKLIYNFLRQPLYSGNVVTCPFCEKSFAKFVSTDILDRPFWRSTEGLKLLESLEINVANAQCPKCDSGERQRLLYFYLMKELSIMNLRGIKMLDVAPDDFLYENVFSLADIDYISIDITPARNPMEIMDVTQLTFSDDTFDAVICLHVLEHISEDLKAMKEIFRVLKLRGWAIIQVPIWAFETVEVPGATIEQYLELYGHSDHVRRYGFDFKEKLEKAGFEVKVDQFSRKLPSDFRNQFGLFETEDIYYCTKS